MRRQIKHSSLVQHNLSGTMSQYHNISHIYVSQIWQCQPSPQISGVISASCTGCCRTEIQFATAQMGEAIASVPQYHMQKCLVCFNTDKADIFRGVSQTIPMKEHLPSGSAVSSKSSLPCSVRTGETKHSLPVYQSLSRLYLGPRWISTKHHTSG